MDRAQYQREWRKKNPNKVKANNKFFNKLVIITGIVLIIIAVSMISVIHSHSETETKQVPCKFVDANNNPIINLHEDMICTEEVYTLFGSDGSLIIGIIAFLLAFGFVLIYVGVSSES